MAINTARRQVNPIYQPKINLLQEQLRGLGASFDPYRQQIEQAKRNAFRDIDTGAQRRNLFFSGFRPTEQARYIGETYTPALTDLGRQEAEQRFNIQSSLADVLAQRGKTTLGQFENIASRQQAAREFQRQLQQQAHLANLQRQATLQAARI